MKTENFTENSSNDSHSTKNNFCFGRRTPKTVSICICSTHKNHTRFATSKGICWRRQATAATLTVPRPTNDIVDINLNSEPWNVFAFEFGVERRNSRVRAHHAVTMGQILISAVIRTNTFYTLLRSGQRPLCVYVLVNVQVCDRVVRAEFRL